jgi:hypothetical protein
LKYQWEGRKKNGPDDTEDLLGAEGLWGVKICATLYRYCIRMDFPLLLFSGDGLNSCNRRRLPSNVRKGMEKMLSVQHKFMEYLDKRPPPPRRPPLAHERRWGNDLLDV